MAAIAFAERAAADWDDGQEIVKALKLRTKAAVSGTEESVLGGGTIAADFLAALRPLTIVGRLPLRRVPSMTPMLTQTVGSRAHWVGEGKARKLSAGTYVRSSLRTKRVSALTVVTEEHLRSPVIDGDSALLADLLDACVQALDEAFILTANTGDDATPASITSTATPIPSSGTDTAALDDDLQAAVAGLVDAGSNLRSAFWIMSPKLAASMALAPGVGGRAYPNIGALGGSLVGLPVLTSGAVAEVDTDLGSDIVLLDASQIAYVEEDAAFNTSTEAAIEMDSAPTGDSTTPTASSANLVSMWQAHCVALLAGISANWTPRRDGVVQVITGVRPFQSF